MWITIFFRFKLFDRYNYGASLEVIDALVFLIFNIFLNYVRKKVTQKKVNESPKQLNLIRFLRGMFEWDSF